MSATDVSPPQPVPTLATDVRPDVPPALSAKAWFRVVVASAALLGSAGVRAWQERRIEKDLHIKRQAKIDLEQIPSRLGEWTGESTKIDEQIARGTGADQIVTRRYVNKNTGTTVELILIYGPAAEVYLHSPEICYPAAGFAQVAGPDDRPVKSGKKDVPFRSLVYAKGEGSNPDRQEVYYTWWYNGRWNPDVGKQKHFERIPGMYKVHLARRVVPDEKRDEGNPCESLLMELLPEIERRMAAAQSHTS